MVIESEYFVYLSGKLKRTKMEWKNVNEEMPCENDDILVVTSDGRRGNAYLSDGEFIQNGYGSVEMYEYTNVLYWMPFPEPPTQ